MRKITVTIIALMFTLNIFAQSWVNFDFTVPPAKVEEFSKTWGEFMASETGKGLPTAFLTQAEAGEQTHTHSILFYTESLDDLGKLFDYKSIFENEDWMKMWSFWSANVEGVRQQYGTQLLNSTNKEGNFFQGIWGIKAINPQTTGAAFAQLIKDNQAILDKYNAEIAIHQAFAGQEGEISHYITGNFKNFATYMKCSSEFYQSEGFGKFAAATSANSNLLTITRTILGAWNLPEN
ncbi:MAG: hypothetical protein CBB99_02275 [Bacteroidetes bacterium TMED39]|nr:MAG: hypothetical protein CBB99_02275 [Bacteroidetes bacterium TMED39]|tara:strand:+ start:9209 stop:9916 length:708 start_codon:yes stop_codon:yes gene_type:complete